LNKHYHACGCDTGAKGLLTGLFGAGLYEAVQFVRDEASFGSAAFTILGTSVLGSLLGKYYGLVRANAKLKETVERIKKEWLPEKAPGETIICG
jgi:hypothetical protein